MKPKQVIVIRRDLNMRRGKEIAQGAHGSCSWLAEKVWWLNKTKGFHLAVGLGTVGGMVMGLLARGDALLLYLLGIPVFLVTVFLAWRIIGSLTRLTPEQETWLSGSFTKICLQVPDLETLGEIYVKAKDAGLNAVMVQDSGVTEFHGEATFTCVAIGPHEPEKIDMITGHLKTY